MECFTFQRRASTIPPMDTSYLISVIVTTYNRPDALALVLKHLSDQTDLHYEIIIADDGSGPETAAVIHAAAQAAPHLRVHHAWQPDAGFRVAQARNQGIAAARGDYLIFLDGDCIPQRDFIARHRALAETGYLVTGSRILLGPKLTAAFTAQQTSLNTLSKPFWIWQRLCGRMNKVLPLFLKLSDFRLRIQRTFQWRGIKGCNLAAWTKDVQAIQGFNDNFTGWGHEDADFVLRLQQTGLHRKKGFLATEVLHLWHPQSARDHVQINYEQVMQQWQHPE